MCLLSETDVGTVSALGHKVYCKLQSNEYLELMQSYDATEIDCLVGAANNASVWMGVVRTSNE